MRHHTAIDYGSRRKIAWAIWWFSASVASGFVALLVLMVRANPDNNLAWLPAAFGLHSLSCVSTGLIIASTLWAKGSRDVVWLLAVVLVPIMLFLPVINLFVWVGAMTWAAAMLWAGRHLGGASRPGGGEFDSRQTSVG